MKDTIIAAAIEAGNHLSPDEVDGLKAYLKVQAIQQPVAFMGLLGKILPLERAQPEEKQDQPEPLRVVFVRPDKESGELNPAAS